MITGVESEPSPFIITRSVSEQDGSIQSTNLSEPIFNITARSGSESFGSMKTFNISVSKCGIIT